MTLKPHPLSTPLLWWYDRSRRDLPWRAPRGELPDPYRVLVSEFMLQQTQVATVIPYFHRFMAAFGTLADLAAADEQRVLRLWQGLGYYSRARNLRACAQCIVEKHNGRIPEDPQSLLTLSGIGRYTAGAIASIAFDVRAPILDGNVARVLCRLFCIESDPRDRATLQLLWQRAEQIMPVRHAGDFNSALMELGATVCTPRSPQCASCPLRRHCLAYAAGKQESIPAPRKARPTPLERRWTFVVNRRGRWLIEQRPAKGRWAGLWQFPTRPANGTIADETAAQLLGLPVTDLRRLGQVKHALTHRRYVFTAFTCVARDVSTQSGGRIQKWVTSRQLAEYPLSKPQLRIAEMMSGR